MDIFSQALVNQSAQAETAPQNAQLDQNSEIVPHHELEDEAHGPDTHTRVVAIAVDGSPVAEIVINWAIKNFIKPTDLVVLLNARPFVTPPGSVYMDVASFIDRQEAHHRAESHKLLRGFASKLKKHKFTTKAISLKGDVHEEIVRKAEEVDAEILIVGSRGLGFLSRVLVGSVGDYCVHNAHCPVIVVKPKPGELEAVKAALAERGTSEATLGA
ncbi:hypothetical protein HDU81_006634 [Chytriomyces hyalinus]|nr:hypothetical protein HDU81_006634 [Chytriomyces hyalinus]